MLDDLIDGSVAQDVRTELEKHLGTCEHCEVTFSTTKKTIQIYRSHELYEMPSGLSERLHAVIKERCKKGC